MADLSLPNLFVDSPLEKVKTAWRKLRLLFPRVKKALYYIQRLKICMCMHSRVFCLNMTLDFA